MSRSQITSRTALKNLIAIVILALAMSSNCLAQARKLIIDTLMHRFAERGQFKGSVLVAENGKII